MMPYFVIVADVIGFVEYALIDVLNVDEFVASPFEFKIGFEPTKYHCTDADVDE